MSTPIINAIIGKASESSYQYKLVVLVGGGTFSDLVTEPNTKYIIKYDFDLGGLSINIPSNCILSIDGGSISNGTLIGNNTVLLNTNKADNILNNITLAGTWGPQDLVCEPNVDDLSVLYFDKTTRKILWWDNDQRLFFEIITV